MSTLAIVINKHIQVQINTRSKNVGNKCLVLNKSPPRLRYWEGNKCPSFYLRKYGRLLEGKYLYKYWAYSTSFGRKLWWIHPTRHFGQKSFGRG